MQQITQVIDVNKLLENLTKFTKKEEIRKEPRVQAPLEIGLSEKFRLLTRRNKKETRSVYVSEINHFLKFARQKENPDAWDLRRFFAYLDKKGFSASYQRNAWYALKIYFKTKELDWPLDKNDYPQLDRSKVKKITLSKPQVVQMIEVTKLFGDPEEKMLLALATIFGLRRAEICALKEKDIDRQNHTLYIHTKKSGEPRYHLIPEEIHSFIYPWDFDSCISTTKASLIFNAILSKSGIEKERGMGIHSIRRRLITELLSTNLPPMRVYNYARWKDRSLGMLAEYDNPDFREVDKLVFESHPFLEIYAQGAIQWQ